MSDEQNKPDQKQDEDARAIFSRRRFMIEASLKGLGVGLAAAGLVTGAVAQPQACLDVDVAPRPCLSVSPPSTAPQVCLTPPPPPATGPATNPGTGPATLPGPCLSPQPCLKPMPCLTPRECLSVIERKQEE